MRSQSPFLALGLGKSELGKSLTIVSLCEWCSNITMKHHFVLSNHGKECADAYKSRNSNFSGP